MAMLAWDVMLFSSLWDAERDRSRCVLLSGTILVVAYASTAGTLRDAERDRDLVLATKRSIPDPRCVPVRGVRMAMIAGVKAGVVAKAGSSRFPLPFHVAESIGWFYFT